MKFRNVLKSRATIKKLKEYEFPELIPYTLEEGKKRKYENKLIVDVKGTLYGLYSNEGKLKIVMYHSYDVFEELQSSEEQKQ